MPMMDQPDLFYPLGAFLNRKFEPSFEDNVTKVIRTHTFKFGFYTEDTISTGGSWAYTNGEVMFTPWGPYNCPSSTAVAGFTVNYTCPGGGTQMGSNNAVVNLLLGTPSSYSENNFQAVNYMGYRSAAGYAMDTWKFNRRLTLDLGVRFDHWGPWRDLNDRTGVAVWLPNSYLPQAEAGQSNPGLSWHSMNPGIPNGGITPHFAYVSPRLGLAYDLFGTGKTVLRGGWGEYRFQNDQDVWSSALTVAQGSKSFSEPVTMSLLQLQELGQVAHGNLGGLASSGSGVNALDNENPLNYSYNLTITQQAPWKSVIEAAYVGNHTRYMPWKGNLVNINPIPMGALFNPDPITLAPDTNPANANTADYSPYGTICLARNPSTGVCTSTEPGYGHSSLNVSNHSGKANYNAFQATWNKRQGWAVYGLNYTWSKALGTCGTSQFNCAMSDPTNPAHDYNVLAIDRSHVFNSYYQFQIGNRVHGFKLLEGAANGWTISGDTNIQSGPDLQAINNNFNLSLTGYCDTTQNPNCTPPTLNNNTMIYTPDISLQPTILCNPTHGLAKHQYINANCFGVPAVGTNGAYRFPYIHGPAYFNSDLSAYKTFKLTERQNLEFRWSAFNFLNHPLTSFNSSNSNNYTLKFQQNADGSFTQTNSTFGLADVKYGRRVMNVGLKYTF